MLQIETAMLNSHAKEELDLSLGTLISTLNFGRCSTAKKPELDFNAKIKEIGLDRTSPSK
jgi:hypothetical protein